MPVRGTRQCQSPAGLQHDRVTRNAQLGELGEECGYQLPLVGCSAGTNHSSASERVNHDLSRSPLGRPGTRSIVCHMRLFPEAPGVGTREAALRSLEAWRHQALLRTMSRSSSSAKGQLQAFSQAAIAALKLIVSRGTKDRSMTDRRCKDQGLRCITLADCRT